MWPAYPCYGFTSRFPRCVTHEKLYSSSSSPHLSLERHRQAGRPRRGAPHQDTQHNNVAARHSENMGSGWWQEESENVTITNTENGLRWPERSKRHGDQLEGRPRVNDWRQRPFERRRTHQLQAERNTAIGIHTHAARMYFRSPR
jgi:hypothetical protein